MTSILVSDKISRMITRDVVRRFVSSYCRGSSQRYCSLAYLGPRRAALLHIQRNVLFSIEKTSFCPRSLVTILLKGFASSVKVVCSHSGSGDEDLEVFSDTLLDFGASSVSVSNVEASKREEMPLYILEILEVSTSNVSALTWEETKITAYFEDPQDADVAFAAVQVRLNLPEVPKFAVSAVEEVLESTHWTKRTQESWIEPFVVGRIVLRFPWHDADSCRRAREAAAAAASTCTPASGELPESMENGDGHSPVVELTLEGGEAFGMGEHPTTVLCLQWLQALEERSRQSESPRHDYHDLNSNFKDGKPFRNEVALLDYGCGSGILGLAALKLKLADTAACVDVDPISLASTQRNATTNSVQHALSTWLPPAGLSGSAAASALDASPAEASGSHEINRNSSSSSVFEPLCPAEHYPNGFNICVANIVQGPLIALAPTLAKLVQPGGVLALSGILNDGAQGAAVYAAYRDFFSDIEITAERDGWLLITGTRSSEDGTLK